MPELTQFQILLQSLHRRFHPIRMTMRQQPQPPCRRRDVNKHHVQPLQLRLHLLHPSKHLLPLQKLAPLLAAWFLLPPGGGWEGAVNVYHHKPGRGAVLLLPCLVGDVAHRHHGWQILLGRLVASLGNLPANGGDVLVLLQVVHHVSHRPPHGLRAN